MSSEGTKPAFGRVGIVGLGLMGGSLARDLGRLHPTVEVRGMTREPRDGLQALSAGAVHVLPDGLQAFFRDLDLVVYCTPLRATLALLAEHREVMAADTLITDVVSLKAPILRTARALDLQDVFVGSHPMAGGEGSGFAASREGLYHGARVWVVAGDAPAEAVARIQGFWGSLGGRATTVEADPHDALMAWVSHLPQVTATALAAALADSGRRHEELGPGGLGMTRLAGSSPEMWLDLLAEAPPAVEQALESLEAQLRALRTWIRGGREGELRRMMEATRAWRKGEPWK